MPDPREGETRDDFLSRCIPEVVAEGKPVDQAVAVCQSFFENKTHVMVKQSRFHRARLIEPEEFEADSLNFVPLDEERGIFAITGIRTDDGIVKLQAILFDADKWTVEDAMTWLTDHNYDPIEIEEGVSEALAEKALAHAFENAMKGEETILKPDHLIAKPPSGRCPASHPVSRGNFCAKRT